MEFKTLLYTVDNRFLTYNGQDALSGGGEFGWLGPVMNIWRDGLFTADDQLALGIL